MSAQYEVVIAALARQLGIHVVAHVRQQHQHVAATFQLGGVLRGRNLRIGKCQPHEIGVVARGVVVMVVIGHHAHHAYPHAAATDDPVGRGLWEGHRVAQAVGAHNVEPARLGVHAPQKGLPAVELVVAQRGYVVTQFVHHVDHGAARLLGHVDEGVARPSVARIGQQGRHGVAAHGRGGGQTGQIVDLGMHVGSGQNDERTTRETARPREITRRDRNGEQKRIKDRFFHNLIFSGRQS